MSVTVYLVPFENEPSVELSFPDANAVDIASGGYLRVLKSEDGRPDTHVGGVAASAWSNYSIDTESEPSA